VPGPTGRGRFDLPARLSRVRYLAESPEHALAEFLHPWRGQTIDDRHLRRAGYALALVEVHAGSGGDAAGGLADLCDPSVLATLAIPPDHIASRHRAKTQPLARAIWHAGYHGLRWWSRFWGDWHTIVHFTARSDGGESSAAPAIRAAPERITTSSPVLQEAARLLGIEVGRRQV
jgi:hypothetical protein